MDYPGNFDTPVYPAGRFLAISRIMAIWSCVVFLLIAALGGLVWWSARSERITPLLISRDWTIIDSRPVVEQSAAQTMQESAVTEFTRAWFQIPVDADAIRNLAGEETFSRFQYDTAADYAARANNGEIWELSEVTAKPAGAITDNGGAWEIHAVINSGATGSFSIRAFATVAHDAGAYPLTAGFYIADWAAYKID